MVLAMVLFHGLKKKKEKKADYNKVSQPGCVITNGRLVSHGSGGWAVLRHEDTAGKGTQPHRCSDCLTGGISLCHYMVAGETSGLLRP